MLSLLCIILYDSMNVVHPEAKHHPGCNILTRLTARLQPAMGEQNS